MDIYDEVDWTEMDIDDLRAAIESRSLRRGSRRFLCRAVEEVARKSAELGLKPKLQS
jgi:hypothetical protein